MGETGSLIGGKDNVRPAVSRQANRKENQCSTHAQRQMLEQTNEATNKGEMATGQLFSVKHKEEFELFQAEKEQNHLEARAQAKLPKGAHFKLFQVLQAPPPKILFVCTKTQLKLQGSSVCLCH